MSTWSDMAQVKKNLWNKLHGAKDAIKDGATQLAQLISDKASQFTQFARGHLPFDDSMVQLESEEINMQVQSEKQTVSKKLQPSTKTLNTQRTMILYFCILTVLLCCCLGKCLVVPIAQAGRYELNSRKHIAKLEKNAFIQQQVIH